MLISLENQRLRELPMKDLLAASTWLRTPITAAHAT
jgi:hypothetical protein